MSFPSDFDSYRCEPEGSAVALDFSGMLLSPDFHRSLEPKLHAALAAMQSLEAGAIANPDENRMVGHYWLRTPALAPNAQIRADIERDIADVRAFAAKVHAAEVRPEKAPAFNRVLVIGIGGSALGPQLVADALGQPGRDRMAMHFLDNTDPEGIERELRRIGGAEGLKTTLAVTISKSGGTPETRNGMLLAAEAYAAAGLQFARHAVVVTGAGSKLDQTAQKEGVLARFPMYDWVGGRTSVMSAVGLLPMALQGLDIAGFLAGASAMDRATRADAVASNPALLMAALWHAATSGRGEKDMVVLPYCDRLLLFSRYLQQLVMESLGKEKDLAGNVVYQGISVYGNKGSTDQHAYVQQLREGVRNFFAVFVEVLSKGGSSLRVEGDATTGDFLNGFLLGTRTALREAGRPTMTLTVERLDAATLGALVALFERTVGFYATMVGINAYHQPGVEAGKKAAAGVLSLQSKLLAALAAAPGESHTADAWAARAGAAGEAEAAFSILRHLAYNGRATMSGRGSKARFAGA